MNPTWLFASVLIMGAAAPCAGAFVPDEFDQPELGAHWKWVDGTPQGSTWTLTGTHLRMHAVKGADYSYVVDQYPYLQQDAPAGWNWEVETKIDNFDPPKGGKLAYNRAGLLLWQDNDHWISVSVVADESGRRRGVQGCWQADPVAGRSTDSHQYDYATYDVSTGSLLLKIRKSRDGYLALMSDDGTTWTPVTPIVRNPQNSPGGEFRPEKIRLFQSGSVVEKPGVPDPADFDYVRMHPVTRESGPFRPDEFQGSGLKEEIWQYYPGLKPGRMEVSRGQARLISAPEQDVWRDRDRASFIYQNAPTGTSWSLVAQIAPTDLRDQHAFSGEGIMVWQDQNHWVMISNLLSSNGENMVEWGYQYQNAKGFVGDRTILGKRPLPAYMRITKYGSRYVCAYSYDLKTWTDAPPGGVDFGSPLQDAQVRLFVKRPRDTPAPLTTAEFEWIHEEPAPELPPQMKRK